MFLTNLFSQPQTKSSGRAVKRKPVLDKELFSIQLQQQIQKSFWDLGLMKNRISLPCWNQIEREIKNPMLDIEDEIDNLVYDQIEEELWKLMKPGRRSGSWVEPTAGDE